MLRAADYMHFEEFRACSPDFCIALNLLCALSLSLSPPQFSLTEAQLWGRGGPEEATPPPPPPSPLLNHNQPQRDHGPAEARRGPQRAVLHLLLLQRQWPPRDHLPAAGGLRAARHGAVAAHARPGRAGRHVRRASGESPGAAPLSVFI